MSRNSHRSGLAVILSSAMVLCMVGTVHAQSGIFVDHNDNVFIAGGGTGSHVVEFGEDELSVSLPGNARIGGTSGPQATPSGAASFSYGTQLNVSGSSFRDEECEDYTAAPIC